MKIKKEKYTIGIDEAGRGPLAGPVVVAALAAPTKLRIQNAELRIKENKNSKFLILNSKLAKLRDSKKLTPRQREIWFEWIKKHSNILLNVGMFYATAKASPKIIDKINISNAANLAATNAFRALIKNYKLRINNCRVYLDGGLFLNSKFCRARHRLWRSQRRAGILNSTTVVRGDEKIPAIALASIVAKVSRDRLMEKLHKKYPKYGFAQHKGYGTKKHIKAIKKYGLSPAHRRSFRIKIR